MCFAMFTIYYYEIKKGISSNSEEMKFITKKVSLEFICDYQGPSSSKLSLVIYLMQLT